MSKEIEVKSLLGGLSKVRTLTPNEPPYKTGTERHERIKKARDESVEKQWGPRQFVDLWIAEPRVAAGVIALRFALVEDIDLRRRDLFRESPAQNGAREAILKGSAGADLALAVYDPLMAIRFEATPWSAQAGVAGGRLSFDYDRNGQRQVSSVPLAPIAAADYDQARARVPGELTQDVIEMLRILCEADDPYTQFALALKLHELPARPATELLFESVALISSLLVQRIKHAIGAPRPDFSTGKTVIATPRYSSYPGGHAFVCAVLSTVLAEMTQASRASRDALDRLAHDIGVRREKAGLHCTYDTDDGLSLGRAVGRWLVLAAQEPAAFPGWSAAYVGAAKEWDPPIVRQTRTGARMKPR